MKRRRTACPNGHLAASRRDFLKQSTLVAGMGVWIAAESRAKALAQQSPNERLNLACIGIGGKGDGDSEQASKHANLIAICDIDDKRLASKSKRHPKAETFNDFRKLFDKLGKQIDAVTITTPDHTHAVATMMAIRMGKAVYTQKPLAHDIWEARQLRLAVDEHKVASQMGNQGTATDKLRAGVEVIQAGLIGSVREVHVWTNRPIWPQSPVITSRPPTAPVPDYVHWDNWLGTAPVRPYAAKYYHPRNWRGWWDFGTGALGDMGCHTTNLPFMALKLGHPSTILAESEKLNSETYPGWARVVYEFPERQGLPPVKLMWYEGHKDGQLVQPPKDLIEKVVDEYNKVLTHRKDKRVRNGKKVALSGSGSIVVGDKGIFYSPNDDGTDWELLPAEQYRDYKTPAQTLPRNPLGGSNKTMDEAQKVEWLAAAKGGPKALSNFDYSGMLAEFILLGNLAIKCGGTKLTWDGPALTFPGNPQADTLLRRHYRAPWTL